MCVYDDIYGWNTIPYTPAPGNFYLEYGDFDFEHLPHLLTK